MVKIHSNNKYIYSVDMMIVYINNNKDKLEKVRLEIKNLLPVLEHNGWGNEDNDDRFSPFDVINDPKKYKKHYDAIVNSDLKYPVIFNRYSGIIDGVHRITKAYLNGKKYIFAYIFPSKLLKKFIIAKSDEWTIVGKMEVYDYIQLYLNRFTVQL